MTQDPGHIPTESQQTPTKRRESGRGDNKVEIYEDEGFSQGADGGTMQIQFALPNFPPHIFSGRLRPSSFKLNIHRCIHFFG